MSDQMYQQRYPQTSDVMANQIPAEVFQQVEIYRLGPLVRVFKPISIWVTLAITVGVILLDIVLMVLLWLVDRVSFYLVLVPILMIIYLVNGIRSNNHKAYLYEGGSIYTNGSEINTIRWDQVEAIYQKIRYYGVTYNTYTIKRQDGAQVVISSHIHKVRELGGPKPLRSKSGSLVPAPSKKLES